MAFYKTCCVIQINNMQQLWLLKYAKAALLGEMLNWKRKPGWFSSKTCVTSTLLSINKIQIIYPHISIHLSSTSFFLGLGKGSGNVFNFNSVSELKERKISRVLNYQFAKLNLYTEAGLWIFKLTSKVTNYGDPS